MALIRDGQLVNDPYTDVSERDDIPADGAIIVSLDQWQAERTALMRRDDPVGLRLTSNQHPDSVAADVTSFALIALEFPTFRDGRAYSYARLLRDRYGFGAELRAIGDVLLEQLHYMTRVGFNAFEIDSETPITDFATAQADFSVWYQASSDDRRSAVRLRHTSTDR
jgi:uncharacterized protein (DUF934 family)